LSKFRIFVDKLAKHIPGPQFETSAIYGNSDNERSLPLASSWSVRCQHRCSC